MRKPRAKPTTERNPTVAEVRAANRINKAREIRDRLSTPLALLITLRGQAQQPSPDMDNLLHECVECLKEARLFVGRYVATKPMDE